MTRWIRSRASCGSGEAKLSLCLFKTKSTEYRGILMFTTSIWKSLDFKEFNHHPIKIIISWCCISVISTTDIFTWHTRNHILYIGIQNTSMNIYLYIYIFISIHISINDIAPLFCFLYTVFGSEYTLLHKHMKSNQLPNTSSLVKRPLRSLKLIVRWRIADFTPFWEEAALQNQQRLSHLGSLLQTQRLSCC